MIESSDTLLALALEMDDGPQESKWEQYYAADPSKTPWDTHAASSQLRNYLCKCLFSAAAANTAAAAAAATGVIAAAATPASASALTSLAQTGAADTATTSMYGTSRTTKDADESSRRSGDRIRNWVGAGAAAHNTWDRLKRIDEFGRSIYGNAKSSDDGNNGGAPGNETLGSEAAASLALHVCDRCACLKPVMKLGTLDLPGGLHHGGVWALELCCGTGGSLAFMHRLGFSVVGVDLVAAACHMAAKRLADVAGSHVAVQPVETVADVLRLLAGSPEPRGADAGAGTEAVPGASPDLIGDRPVALVAHGNLFVAAWPRGFFHFVYDCQGLHAMPPALRPAYVTVLRSALRSGGLALLLVGRVEDDLDFDSDRDLNGTEETDVTTGTPTRELVSSTAAQRGRDPGGEGCEEMSRGNPGGCGGDPLANRSCNSRGPSLMSRRELHELFGDGEWEWCWCKPTRFDSTPAYDKLPRPPPAWCLLMRRL